MKGFFGAVMGLRMEFYVDRINDYDESIQT